MINKRSQEIKVGIVSIAGLALLLIGLMLAKGWNVTVNKQPIKFRFPHSRGIQPSSLVVVNGVERGSVTDIINENGSVLVSAVIEGVEDIKQDASARILIMEITGGKIIDIDPGSSDCPYSPGDIIAGESPPDIPELVALIGSVSDDAIILLRRLDTIAIAATDLLDEGKTVGKLKNTFHNTEQITGKLNNFLDNNIASLEFSLRELKSLSSELRGALDRNEPKLAQILEKVDYTLDDTRGLLSKMDSASVTANGLLADLKAISSDIREGHGFASRIIYDDKLAAKLDSTITVLYNFLSQVKKYGVNVNARLGTRP